MPSIICTIEYPEDDDKLDEDYEVFFNVTPGSPEIGPSYASGGEPASPAEFEIDYVKHEGTIVEVSDEMLELFYEEIENRWDGSDEDEGPDPDYLRDLREDR